MEITSELQLTLSFRLAMVFEYRSTYQALDLLTVHRVLGQKASLSSVLLYLSTVVLASRFCSFVACMQGSFASVAAFLEYKEVICLVSKRYSETGPIKSQAPLNSMSGQIGKSQFRLTKQCMLCWFKFHLNQALNVGQLFFFAAVEWTPRPIK